MPTWFIKTALYLALIIYLIYEICNVILQIMLIFHPPFALECISTYLYNGDTSPTECFQLEHFTRKEQIDILILSVIFTLSFSYSVNVKYAERIVLTLSNKR